MKRSTDFGLIWRGARSVARIGFAALLVVVISSSFVACSVTHGVTPVETAVTQARSDLDSAKLMDGINVAMAALDNLHMTGQIVYTAKTTDLVLGYERYEAHGRFAPDGLLRATITRALITESHTVVSTTNEWRRVDGVTYVYDDAWEIDPEAWTDDAIDQALSGRLALADITTTKELLDEEPVYRVIGHVSNDPTVEQVVLWVDVRDLLIRKIRITGSEYPNELATSTYYVTGTNEPLEVVAPEIVPALPPVMTPHGQMATYRSAELPLAILYPVDCEQRVVLTPEMTAWFVSKNGVQFMIAEENLEESGLAGAMTLKEYVDLVVSVTTANTEQKLELVSRETRVTSQGLPVEVVEFAAFGVFRAIRLIYLHEGRIGFSAAYMFAKNRSDDLMPIVEYSFNSLRLDDETKTLRQRDVERVPTQQGYRLSASIESRSPSL